MKIKKYIFKKVYSTNDIALKLINKEKLNDFRNLFNNWGMMIVFIGAFTPLPYKVIAISAGASGIFLPIFILGSIIGRGLRFYIISYLTYFYGESAIKIINKNFIR